MGHSYQEIPHVHSTIPDPPWYTQGLFLAWHRGYNVRASNGANAWASPNSRFRQGTLGALRVMEISIEAARRERARQQTALTTWRTELWRAGGDYQGEDWQEILQRIEECQRALVDLEAILKTTLPESAQVIHSN